MPPDDQLAPQPDAPAPEPVAESPAFDTASSPPADVPAVVESNESPIQTVPAAPEPTATTAPVVITTRYAPHTLSSSDRTAANATRLSKRELKLTQLISFARTRKTPLSNNDIQIALGLTDITATRYAKLLVARGMMRKEGTGRSTRYVLTN